MGPGLCVHPRRPAALNLVPPGLSPSHAVRTANRLAWLQSGLFWRTFFLLAFLITVSMAAWVVGIREVERAPRAKQIAAQVVSIVTITRAALTHSAPELRRELLVELASNEGIQVYPLEDTDQVVTPVNTALLPIIVADVRARLGSDTRFADRVNNIPGFWISFNIEDDKYWLVLDRERIERPSGIQWLGWAAVTLSLSLLGAVVISRLINQPLARLSAATRAVAKGQRPELLPESGPTEIREANLSFNQMVEDLHRVESDREVILAGISHDLRTPISRMFLELEMADLPVDAKDGMQADLAQMNAIIGQFLDYARPSDDSRLADVNLSALLEDAVREAARMSDLSIEPHIEPEVWVRGNSTELQRVFNNVVENARRYGKTEGSGNAEVDVDCRSENGHAIIEFSDRGPGIPDSEMDRLLRPFTRLDTARGQANGAGLGLAIVDRVVRRHGGKLRLSRSDSGGFALRVELPMILKTAVSRF